MIGGGPIAFRGTLDFTGPGLMMDGRLSCPSCHRQQARGGVHMVHMQVMEAPDIRWSVLAEAPGTITPRRDSRKRLFRS